jgi:hypothetical protein
MKIKLIVFWDVMQDIRTLVGSSNILKEHFIFTTRVLRTEAAVSSETSVAVNQTDIMCFLWGTDKPIELSWVLNIRQDDG